MMRLALPYFLAAWLLAPAPCKADVFADVPQARGYTLIYSLSIPLRGGFATSPPTYQVDRSKSFQGSIRKIAYYLSLQPRQGKRQYVFASMDAFTQDVGAIGVPHAAKKIRWQQPVKTMDVFSNVPGLATGTGLSGGSLEFWPTNYVPANGARVPKASDAVYDTGDTPVATGSYGSMQIHLTGKNQTLLAYNNWGGRGTDADLGIGNNGVKAANGLLHTDWTFRRNAGSYTQRLLQVLVLQGPPPPGTSIQLRQPQAYQVHQRQPGDVAQVRIAGVSSQSASRVEARGIPLQGGKASGWKVVASQLQGSAFAGTLGLRSGWYKLQVRTLRSNQVLDTKEIAPVGVGEVFVIAGQSNSANHGDAPTRATDPRVASFGHGRWGPAADPMPVATGTGGSPWPTLGDILARRWDVPIGLLSVGVGGTRVDQWVPTASSSLYPRIKTALLALGPRGLRAILWHQGESDTVANTTAATYAKRLDAVIQQSRADAGFAVPWYVALASYLPRATKAQMQQVLQGQKQVAASSPHTHQGPTTDDMIGSKWRYDAVHFNLAGLKEHARRWAQVLGLPPCQGFRGSEDHDCEPKPSEPGPEPPSERGPEPQEPPRDRPAQEPPPTRDAAPEPSIPDPPGPEPLPPSPDRGPTTPTPDAAPDQTSPRRSRGCSCDASRPTGFWLACLGLLCLALRRRRSQDSR